MATIWWPEVCNNRTLYDAFWSYELTVATPVPDLTNCLQQTVLVWQTYGLFILISLFYGFQIQHKPIVRRPHQKRAFNIFKTFLSSCLLACAVVDGIWSINTHENFEGTFLSTADGLAFLFRGVALVCASVIIPMEFTHGIGNSGQLFLFWLFSAATESIRLYSLSLRWSKQDIYVEDHTFAIQAFFVAFVLIQLICHCWVDRNALGGQQRNEIITATSDEKTPLLPMAISHTPPSVSHKNNTFIKPKDSDLADPSPHAVAPFWNRYLFVWLFRYIKLGYQRTLEFQDLPNIPPGYSTASLLEKFNWHYYTCSRRDRRSGVRYHNHVAWAVTLSVWRPLVLSCLCRTLTILLAMMSPQILGWILAHITSDLPYLWQGLVLSFFLVMNGLLNTIISANIFMDMFSAGMQARTILNAVVYRKALRMSSTSWGTSSGQVVNLMSVDAQKAQDLYQTMVMLITAPLSICLTVYLLYVTIGYATFIAILLLVIIFPVNAMLMGRKVATLQRSQMAHKDNRLRLMNDILAAMKVIKFNAWAEPFLKRILNFREEELKKIKYSNYFNALSYVIMAVSPILVSLAVFSTYTLTSIHHVLEARTAFVALGYINLLNAPISTLPGAVMGMAQGIVSFKRIERFLNMDEIPKTNSRRGSSDKETAVKISGATYDWTRGDGPALREININVRRGRLVAVVGHVGSGKSALIKAILGELPKTQGTSELNGSVAYAPQTPWILNATLRDNILFGKTFDEDRYRSVCQWCALTPDMDVLPAGDLTEIGEKGINLSGGQKQRVTVARAAYQSEDIYLLDDPLSGLDANVTRHIFNKIISHEGLLKFKTRIIVTHCATYLSRVDYIYVMRDGSISEAGTFDDLVDKNGDFAEFLRTYVTEQEPESHEHADDILQLVDRISGSESSDQGDKIKNRCMTLKQKLELIRNIAKGIGEDSSRVRPRTRKDSPPAVPLAKENADPVKARLMTDEVPQTGTVQLGVMLSYMRTAGLGLSALTIVVLLAFTINQFFSSVWLAAWTSDPDLNDTQANLENTRFRLEVYGLFGIGQTILSFLCAFALATGCYRASRCLHHELIARLLRAPLAYFDTTPAGRILNRFSKDLDILDMDIPNSLRLYLTFICPVAVTFVIIVYTYPYFTIAAVPVVATYVVIKNVYMRVARQFKRMDAVRRSPVYSQFGDAIQGACSIRAYDRVNSFVEQCDRLIDESQRPWFMLVAAQRWFSIQMGVVSGIIVMFTALFSVLAHDVDPSLAGLSLSYALALSQHLNQVVRQACELEAFMVSVERLEEYRDLPLEEDGEPECEPPDDWPMAGCVRFRNYSVRYRPGLDYVLDDINFTVNGGEKVAIVGHSGAGKTSLALGLFRLFEPNVGTILIDNIDITDISLHALRSKISIIPQEPVLFSGSLRFNLDPADEYQDIEVWNALRDSHLLDYFHTMAGGLYVQCGENGENLSVGQRQLVCLSRALLRKSRVLVLDEATAAVDLETDALIQDTIRTRFNNCTILTVAHRISTVMEYDRIMVIEKGRLVEFDKPQNLLRRKKSVFRQMARDSGLF